MPFEMTALSFQLYFTPHDRREIEASPNFPDYHPVPGAFVPAIGENNSFFGIKFDHTM